MSTVLICMGICSCSIFSPGEKQVRVRSNYPDAELRADGAYIGRGEATVMLAKNRGHTISAHRGEQEERMSIGSHISATGILDIVGGFIIIVPFIGLFSRGAWTLDHDTVTIDLP